MSEPVEFDMDALKEAAINATSATRGENWRYSPNYSAITTSKPGILEGCKMVADICNGADFEKERIGNYIAAAQPAVVLELIRRLRIAEAVGEANMLRLNSQAGDILAFGIEPEFMPEFQQAIAGALLPGMRALIMEKGIELRSLNEEAMHAAGWMRKPEWHPMSEEPPFPFTGVIKCGGGILHDAAWCSGYWRWHGREIGRDEVTHWRAPWPRVEAPSGSDKHEQKPDE